MDQFLSTTIGLPEISDHVFICVMDQLIQVVKLCENAKGLIMAITLCADLYKC